ncbi:tyrosine-type recombinase/integrase [Celeribacter sp. SCSIO 80788]|uniref:tyrosine-type recombinase/integrase n=1 Tax=Celeribacter sp. SCSIO 80788 TaxID=3117013 RepID=UPI003DA3BA3A
MKKELPKYVYRMGRGNHPHFRWPRGSKPIRIKSETGTVEFQKEYTLLLSEAKRGIAQVSAKYTMSGLIESYQQSERWNALSDRTQKDYQKVLDFWAEKTGARDIRRFERKHIIAAMDANKDAVRFANYVMQVARVLFEHSIDLGWRKDNPAQGVKSLKMPKAKRLDREPWPAEKIKAFRARYAFETRERLLFELCLGSGQRIGDVLEMRWSDIEGDAIRVVQNKTGKGLLVPLTSDLRSALASHRSINAASRRQSVFMLTNARRSGPWSYRGASQAIRNAREAVGALKWDIHSLRHAAATELYEVGCDVPMIMAVTGMSEKMVRHYTARANQFSLASKAQLKREK